MLRGIRGATTADSNTRAHIVQATKELLELLISLNNIDKEEVGAVIFSSTADLNAAFPAIAAREIGWTEVPLFGTLEIDCPTAIKSCVRILILLNTELSQKQLVHGYLNGAEVLRPEFKA